MIFLKKANKNKFCDKCGNEIKKNEEYRVRNLNKGERENFCSNCFAFLVSHYSLYDDWSKYQFTEKEKELINQYIQKMNNWI